jgi:hypothetical protein
MRNFRSGADASIRVVNGLYTVKKITEPTFVGSAFSVTSRTLYSGFLFRRAIARGFWLQPAYLLMSLAGGSGIFTGGATPVAAGAGIAPTVVPQQPQVLTAWQEQHGL